MSEAHFVKLVTTALKAGGIDKAESRVEVERVLGVLKELEQFDVTETLLRKTSGGKLVRKLCKSRVTDISDAAKKVIKGWKEKVLKLDEQTEKEFLQKAFPAKSRSGSLDLARTTSLTDPELPIMPTTDLSSEIRDSSSNVLSSSTSLARRTSISSAAAPATGNKARDVARHKFTQLLETEAKKMAEVAFDSAKCAQEIEKAIHAQNGAPSQDAYKSKFRTLYFNLKDPKNGLLRQRIMSGELTAEQLVNLSTEELANEEKKRENDDIRKSKLRECERGVQQGATTDAFKCGKCKNNECTYYQMQTRSADEPMTVYVTCTRCGNRWKC